MPVQGTHGELRLVLLMCLARPCATPFEWHVIFSCVREMLVVEVVLLMSGG